MSKPMQTGHPPNPATWCITYHTGGDLVLRFGAITEHGESLVPILFPTKQGAQWFIDSIDPDGDTPPPSGANTK